MRAYLPLAASDIAQFLDTKKCVPVKLYAPTIKFLTANVDHDEEEIEYLLSLMAAGDAMEMITNGSTIGTLLALEIPDSEIAEEGEDSIVLNGDLLWERVECLFTSIFDDEGDIELTWFATQEIEDQIASLVKDQS